MKKFLITLIFAAMLVCIITGCGSTVPRPEIKKGEFDFSVTYEFNGEEKTVSGVYVCEYNGTSWALDGGFHREWKGYIKDGKTEDVIEIGTTKDGGKAELTLALYPDYFMGDFVEGYHDVPKPYLSVTLIDDEGMTVLHGDDEVEEYCGARIVSYEYGDPIENSFSILN